MNNLMSFGTINHWVFDVLSATTDYNAVCGLVNTEDIASELMQYNNIDVKDVEAEINKRLLELGCTYDEEDCFWDKPKLNIAKVLIIERLQCIVDVEIEDGMSPEDIINIVRDKYNSEEIVLDSSDYSDTSFEIYEE